MPGISSSRHEPKNVVVLVLDHLSPAFLGPYGNTWVDTPQWNRLAAESFVLDAAWAESIQLRDTYAAYWRGVSVTAGPPSTPAPLTLAQQLQTVGVKSILVSDEPEVIHHDASLGFVAKEWVQTDPATQASKSIEESQLGQFFAALLDEWERMEPPFLLWAHARGFGASWDAPYAWREQFKDEEDPSPPTWIEPPCARLSGDPDPDFLLGLAHAYAAQVVLSDTCLGVMLDALAARRLEASTLLVVTSPRGYPLGEHGRVGMAEPALYGELLHLPWFIRSPGGAGALGRSPALVQPVDLFATIRDWYGLPSPAESEGFGLPMLMSEGCEWPRKRALSRHGREWSVRDAQWFLRRSAEGAVELYAKPDDRFEANEVASRCPQVVAELMEALPLRTSVARSDGLPEP